jgi:hypothetical protein
MPIAGYIIRGKSDVLLNSPDAKEGHVLDLHVLSMQ